MRRRKLKPGGRRMDELRKALGEDNRSQPRIVSVLIASWEAKSRDLIDDGEGEEDEEMKKKKKKSASRRKEGLEDSDGMTSIIKTASDVGLAEVKREVIDGERGGPRNGGGGGEVTPEVEKT